MEQILNNDDLRNTVIRAPYIPDMNNGITVQQRLKKLKEEIYSQGLIELD